MTDEKPASDAPLWISGGLVLCVVLVFGQTLQHDFISYDDPLYVTGNDMVRQGLTGDSIRYAFTAVVGNIWHPLTLLSHMLDVELFGMRPGLHHAMNVVLHASNAVLLFHLLRVMTGSTWRSALVAALFAVHPLRAESVAWASERKDVLSAFFWLWTTFAYVYYVRARSALRYLTVAVLFVLGLLAKPMLVTLPFTLLLLDYWPLRRVGPGGQGVSVRRLVLEKIPLFLLAGAAAAVSFWSQSNTGAVGNFDVYPLWARLANAAIAYLTYLRTTFVPIGLAPMYPHAGTGTSLAWAAVGALVVVVISVAALFGARTRPYVLVGWCWFVGTLVPVIGIVQVGTNSHADRYTYIPQVGLLIAVVWLGYSLVGQRDGLRRVAVGASVAILVAMAGVAHRQVGYWKNTVTLFRHNVVVSPLSERAHFNLGIGYAMNGRPRLAEPEFRASLALNPYALGSRKNLGAALLELGEPAEAADLFHELIRMEPYEPEHHLNLAIALYHQGKFGQAIFRAEEALRIDETYERASALIVRCRHSLEPEIFLGEEPDPK